jgi:hypothetical protein
MNEREADSSLPENQRQASVSKLNYFYLILKKNK